MNDLVNRIVDGVVRIATQAAVTYSVVPRCRECEVPQLSCPDSCCNLLLPFACLILLTGILAFVAGTAVGVRLIRLQLEVAGSTRVSSSSWEDGGARQLAILERRTEWRQ